MTQLTFPLATMLAFCRIIRKPDAGKLLPVVEIMYCRNWRAVSLVSVVTSR